MGLLVLWPAVAFAQPAVDRFYGTAKLDGVLVPAGTTVAGTIDGDTYSTTADAAGNFVLTITQPEGKSYTGKSVTFTVKGFAATQTATWTAGEVTNLNLTALSAPPTPAEALTGIAGKYDRVWGYDSATQAWKLYDPAVPAVSDLTALERGKGYWVKAKEAVTLIYGGNSYSLAKGWNLIGWLD